MSSAGCWIARENENVNAQGRRDLKRRFIAFSRVEANSGLCPPDRNATPGTAAGTVRSRPVTVASAISSTLSWGVEANPGSTMLGFNSIPSSSTR